MRVLLLAVVLVTPAVAAQLPPLPYYGGVPPLPVTFPFAGEYLVHRPADVEAALLRIERDHPELAKVEPIGESVLGDELWRITLRSPDAEPRYTAYLDGGHHAGEHLGVELVMVFLGWLVEGYVAGDERALRLLADYEIRAVPMVNPDGNYLSTRTNANGVNLNRNYPYQWGVEPGSSGDPNSGNYRGPAPLSEPESRALWEDVNATRPAAWITMHTGIAEMYWPWGWTADKAPDWRMFESLEKPFEEATNGRLDAKQGFELYAVTGANDDSGYAIFGVPGYTIEVHEDGGPQPYPNGIPAEIADQLQGLVWLVETSKLHGANVRAVSGVVGSSTVVRLVNDGWGDARNLTLRVESPGEPDAVRVVDVPARGETTVDLGELPAGAQLSGTYRRLLIGSSPVWDLTVEGEASPTSGALQIPAAAGLAVVAAAVAVALARRRYV